MGLSTAQVPWVGIVLTSSDTRTLQRAVPSESCFKTFKQIITKSVLILPVIHMKTIAWNLLVLQKINPRNTLPKGTVRPGCLTPWKNIFRGLCAIDYSQLRFSPLPPFIQLCFLPAYSRSLVYNAPLNTCLHFKCGSINRILFFHFLSNSSTADRYFMGKWGYTAFGKIWYKLKSRVNFISTLLH